MAADIAEIKPGNVVCVLGCGPVGQFAIWSAMHLGAGRVIAVVAIPDRLDLARAQGAETVNLEEEDPVELIGEMTGAIGLDRVIDAVGVDANRPSEADDDQFKEVIDQLVPQRAPEGPNWQPGSGPTQALQWAIDLVSKAGTVTLIGVYPPTVQQFSIGDAMFKNLTLTMGNCNHRKYIPRLLELVRANAVDPLMVLTEEAPIATAIEAYEQFDRRESGWTKVMLEPAATGAA